MFWRSFATKAKINIAYIWTKLNKMKCGYWIKLEIEHTFDCLYFIGYLLVDFNWIFVKIFMKLFIQPNVCSGCTLVYQANIDACKSYRKKIKANSRQELFEMFNSTNMNRNTLLHIYMAHFSIHLNRFIFAFFTLSHCA